MHEKSVINGLAETSKNVIVLGGLLILEITYRLTPSSWLQHWGRLYFMMMVTQAHWLVYLQMMKRWRATRSVQ